LLDGDSEMGMQELEVEVEDVGEGEARSSLNALKRRLDWMWTTEDWRL